MSISKIYIKIKSAGERNLIIIMVILVGLLTYGIVQLSFIYYSQIPARAINATSTTSNNLLNGVTQAGLLIGSKNSNKYHLPWCTGATRIKEENKIWFDSKETAQRRGYIPAQNCPGL